MSILINENEVYETELHILFHKLSVYIRYPLFTRLTDKGSVFVYVKSYEVK